MATFACAENLVPENFVALRSPVFLAVAVEEMQTLRLDLVLDRWLLDHEADYQETPLVSTVWGRFEQLEPDLETVEAAVREAPHHIDLPFAQQQRSVLEDYLKLPFRKFQLRRIEPQYLRQLALRGQ
jgi:hypothetical protein